MYEFFVTPLVEFAFMRYGLSVVAVVGVVCAVMSCLLVVRRQALLGDAISHAVLLGVVLGWLIAREMGLFWGALIVGTLTGAGVTFIERNSRIKVDAAMGVMFTFAFALALVVISIVKPTGIDLFHVLMGNVLGVGPNDLILTAASGGAVILTVCVLFRAFHLWSFDPTMARAAGFPVSLLHYLFTALLSASIVAALQSVGIILVIAMLVTPGAAAYLLTDRFGRMMVIAAVIGLSSGVGGLYGSYHLDVASGPAMVVFASVIFFHVFCLAPRRGLLVRIVRRRVGQWRTPGGSIGGAAHGRPALATGQSLAELGVGQSARVFITGADGSAAAAAISRLGVVPQATFSVAARSPEGILLKLGGKRVELSWPEAERIVVLPHPAIV